MKAPTHRSLFFHRYIDLEQRLCLFEAGVDDCVCEPFFASEMAVRLGLSIRLRQAASDLGGIRHGKCALCLRVLVETRLPTIRPGNQIFERQ
jgi:DNA-binding response OmpR family regulator